MTTFQELADLLPDLLDKVATGEATQRSYDAALDLVNWGKRGKQYSDKQNRYIETLANMAKGNFTPGSRVEKCWQEYQTNGATGFAKLAKDLGLADSTVKEWTRMFERKAKGEILPKRQPRSTPPAAVVPVNVDTDAIVKQVLGELDGKFTVELVDSVVKSLDARVPRRIEVSLNGGKAKAISGAVHGQFEKLVKAANARLPNGYAPGIFLQGEASSGKTTGAKMLADVLGLKWYFNGAITFPHEMLGFIDGHGKYHRTPFRDAYEFGGVYTFDEVDRSDPVALLAVNPHLANGIATFPDKQVKRHKDCIIICTANTWGLGADANYSGATKLDAAFLSRFPIRINWDIDPALESQIVPNTVWLDKVRGARAKARTFGLKVMIDTRIAQAGAALIEAGYSMDEAAQMTYLANLKPEQRTQLQ